MKKLTVREFATVKRIAQSVNGFVSKKDKALEKIDKLQKEVDDLQQEIDDSEVWIKGKVNLTSEDLVKRVVEETGKMDAKGNPIKVTKYVPTDIIEYSEEDKCYYIKEDIIKDADFEDVPSEEEEKEDFMSETL